MPNPKTENPKAKSPRIKNPRTKSPRIKSPTPRYSTEPLAACINEEAIDELYKLVLLRKSTEDMIKYKYTKLVPGRGAVIVVAKKKINQCLVCGKEIKTTERDNRHYCRKHDYLSRTSRGNLGGRL